MKPRPDRRAARAPAPSASHLLPLGDGGRLEVLVDEPARTATLDIVLLPSSQRDSRDFGALAGLLAAHGLRVLRPQPRGMGASSAPPADMTLHTLAGDVALAIEALGGGARALVAGHAYGHFVARVAALDHPRHVHGVAVLAGAARSFPAGLTAALDIAADAQRPQDERRAALEHAFFAPGNDPTSWLTGWYPEWRAAYRRAALTPAKDLWWPTSPVPVLDLQAAQDPWRPPATHGELKEVLGDAVTVQVVAGASHALVPEQPRAVADALAAWARTLV